VADSRAKYVTVSNRVGFVFAAAQAMSSLSGMIEGGGYPNG
jgi:hypothetical protein